MIFLGKNRWIRLLCIALGFLLCGTAGLQAESAPALAGFESGVALSGRAISYSSPLIAELDGDHGNGREIVAATPEGRIYAHRADGSLLWSAAAPNMSCGAGKQKLFSSPAAGDLYGTGVPHVVIGYGGVGVRDCDGGVLALRGPDGAIVWNFSVKNFSKRQHFWAFRYSIASTPALADVDGDGKMEIGFGGFDRNVYLLNHNGKVRWYYTAADTVWSSPAFADINGDGRLELIAATDISANKKLRPPTPNGGFMYAFKTEKRRKPKIGFRDAKAYYWQATFDQVLYSSPSIADIIPENPGREVVIGSGCFFPQNNSNKTGRWAKVLSLSNGQLLATLNAPACFTSSPAIADLDGDGRLEVVATVNGHTSIGGGGPGQVVAWKPPNPNPFWTTTPRVRGNSDPWLGQFKSAVVADLDGNGSLEVAAAVSSGIAILAGANGQPLTCQSADCSDNALLIRTGSTVQTTPAIGDVDNDGILDIVAGSGSGGRGKLYVWTGFAGLLNSAPGQAAPYATPWPAFRNNKERNGNY